MAIGRYSATVFAPLTFEINLAYVVFIETGRCPVLKKAWTSLVIASPITCQYAPITRLYCLVIELFPDV